MKIGLIGNYGATNIGDDAILSAILKSHPKHEWLVFSANPQATSDRFGVKTSALFPLGIRSFFKTGFRKPLKSLRSVDAVVLGGGGLMQDDKPMACLIWAWQVFWVRMQNKPLFIYATGVGPLKTRLGKWLTKWVYNYAVAITVRDDDSFNELLKLGLEADNIALTADPAFMFKHIEHEHGREPHSYLVSLRPWLNANDKIVELFTKFLLKLKTEKGAHFKFVCMQSIREHDRKVIEPLMKRVGGTLMTPNNFTELLQAMERAEFAIGMRYHFLIASMLTKTPVLAVSYSPKVDGLFKNTDLSAYLMSVREMTPEMIENKLARLSVGYNNAQIHSKKRAEHLKVMAERNIQFFDGFVKTLTEEAEAVKVSEQN